MLELERNKQLGGKEAVNTKANIVRARDEMRQRIADQYIESPSLLACNQKLAAIDKQIAGLGERTSANGSKLDQLQSLKETVNRLITLFESKRRQWQYYESLHVNIAAELTALLAEQPESLAQYPVYLQKIQSLTKRLTHIAERQRLFTGDESVKGSKDKSHGLASVVAPGVAVISATKEFVGKEISKLDKTESELNFEPTAEDKMQAEYFAKLKGRTGKDVREFYDSTEYKDLRRAFDRELNERVTNYRERIYKYYPNENTDPKEIEQYLNLQFAKMVGFKTPEERQKYLEDLKLAIKVFCHSDGRKFTLGSFVYHEYNGGYTRSSLLIKLTYDLIDQLTDHYQKPNAKKLARLQLAAKQSYARFSAYSQEDDLTLNNLRNLAITTDDRYGEGIISEQMIEVAAKELLAEILPFLNRRQAKLRVTKPGATILTNPGEVPELRVDNVNGNVELVQPPLPEANTIGAIAFQNAKAPMEAKVLAEAKAIAEKKAKLELEDVQIRAIVKEFEAGIKLGEEIEDAYKKAIKLGEGYLQAKAHDGFAQAELARLRGEYDPLAKELKGIIVLKRKEKAEKAEALAGKMNKLLEQTSPTDDTVDPYEKFSIQANRDRQTHAEFDLSDLVRTTKEKITAYRKLFEKIKAMQAMKFLEPVQINPNNNWHYGNEFSVTMRRQGPEDRSFAANSDGSFSAIISRLSGYYRYFEQLEQGKDKMIEVAKESVRESNPFAT